MRLVRLLALLALVAASAAPARAGAQVLNAREAVLEEVDRPFDARAFPYVDAGGGAGAAEFRVVQQTGNCCENYVATTPAGRLLDFGGNYVLYSDDEGETWTQVTPDANFLGGEGAIVVAPNGDVLGVGWDPYTGDQLLAFKYDAEVRKWRYVETPLHTPFYDREWIGVVPGPITVGGDTFPYVSFVKGGYPSKEEWLVSTDGLNYSTVSSKFVDSAAGPEVNAPLRPVPAPSADFVQANGGMGLTPLGAGTALAAPDRQTASYALLDPATLKWSRYSFPNEAPEGQFHADSRGRLHNVIATFPDDLTNASPGGTSLEYRISEDGGASWRATSVSLPPAHTVENVDFRVHGALGLAAVAVHAHDAASGNDQDLLYKLDVRGAQPALLRSYEIGLGDIVGGSNVLSITDPRFDFETLAFLPDGRVVMSFFDSETRSTPALAIERSAPVPPGFAAVPAPSGPLAPPRPGGSRPGRGATDPAGPRGRAHRVTLAVRRRGAKVLFSGTVLPRHPGHVVLIQRRSGSRWTTVAKVRAGRRSSFRATRRLVAAGGARFRAVALGGRAGHRTGRSRAVAVR